MTEHNVVVIGSGGMLGRAVMTELGRFGIAHVGLSHEDIDITDVDSIRTVIPKESTHVVNCAAATNTTKCSTKDGIVKSYAINALGVKLLSEFCREHDKHLVHISTDAVYSENSADIGNMPFPFNVYGCHKLLGEMFAREAFAGRESSLSILRCSWLYGDTGGKKLNFVDKVEKAAENGVIRMVDDCFGHPTSVVLVAKCIVGCIMLGHYGISDCCTNSGPISRFDFTKMIVGVFNEYGLLGGVTVEPVKSSEFESPINQSMMVPSTLIDESGTMKRIFADIDGSSDYMPWLRDYIVGFKNINRDR